MVNYLANAFFLLGIISLSSQESVNLPDLDPQDAQQIIEQQDTSLKYAPKVESNVPAVRYLGNEPHNVVEDIYLANQYHGQDGLGGYLYGYSVPDIAKTEKKIAGGDLRGAYNYIAGNGQEIKVEYWDDGTGFHQIDNLPKNLPEDLPAVKAEKEKFFKRWQEEAERNSRPVEDPYDSEGQYKQGPLSPQGQLIRQQQFAAQFGKSSAYKQPEGAASQQSSIYQSNLEKTAQPYSANYQPYQGKDQQNQGVYQSKQTHSSYTKGPQSAGSGYGGQSGAGYGSSGNGGYGSQPSGGYGQSQNQGGYNTGGSAYGSQSAGYGAQKPAVSSGYGSQSNGGSSGYGNQSPSGATGYGSSGQSSTVSYGGQSTSAYGAKPSGGSSGYGGQTPSGGYGSQPSSGSAYGGQSTSAYGAKPSGGSSGYGGQISPGGYSSQPSAGSAYGGQSTSTYGAKPSSGSSGYGGQISSGGYGSQPSAGTSYGGQSSFGYGAKPASGYGGQNSGYGGSVGYGKQPSSGGYGGQSGSGYGQSSGAYLGQSSQNVNKYTSAQSSYGQASESHSKYANQGEEDDGSYKPGKDEEQGPPRGFFYKFDYPVGIIVSKQGPAQGGSYGQGGYQHQEKKQGSY